MYPIGAAHTPRAMRIRRGYYVRAQDAPNGIVPRSGLSVWRCGKAKATACDEDSLLGGAGAGGTSTGGTSPCREGRDSDSDSPCLGGTPGNCRTGHTSLACGACDTDYYMDNTGSCEKCGSLDWLLLTFAFFVCLAVPLIAYFAINSPPTPKLNQVSIVCLSFGLFIAVIQLSIVVSRTAINWPTTLGDFFARFQILVLETSSLRSQCLLGEGSASDFLCIVLAPYVILGGLLGVSWLSRRVYPETKNPARFRMRYHETVNVVGTLFQALFIALLLFLLHPFRCYEHPNGMKSMVKYPHIVCDSGEDGMYGIMVAISLSVMVLVILPFFVFYVYHIIRMPELSLVDPEHLRTTKFIA